jgi:aryl-alcohol dehydrogenase-like predicted oxidoreductase
MHARQFAQALQLQRATAGRDRYAGSLQPDHREEENEMLPLCHRAGVSVIRGSLGAGRLTRPWGETTARLVSDEFGNRSTAQPMKTMRGLRRILLKWRKNSAPIAPSGAGLAASKPGVAAPIVGLQTGAARRPAGARI